MRTLLVVIIAVGMSLGGLESPSVLGQEGGDRPRRQFRYRGSTGQSLTWLLNPQIAKELELVPEQKEKLGKIRSEMADKMRKIYTGFGDVDPDENSWWWIRFSRCSVRQGSCGCFGADGETN